LNIEKGQSLKLCPFIVTWFLYTQANRDLSVGDFASAEATDAAVGSRDLLKKVDQNLKKGNGYVVHLLFDVELVIISRRNSYIRRQMVIPSLSSDL
jgi:hypothetical protein